MDSFLYICKKLPKSFLILPFAFCINLVLVKLVRQFRLCNSSFKNFDDLSERMLFFFEEPRHLDRSFNQKQLISIILFMSIVNTYIPIKLFNGRRGVKTIITQTAIFYPYWKITGLFVNIWVSLHHEIGKRCQIVSIDLTRLAEFLL